MDQHFEKFRKQVPHLKRRPSEYLREHIWWMTQPIEEPQQSRHILKIIDWIGWDRLLYFSDYPHWDYDNPNFSFKFPMTEEQRRRIPGQCPGIVSLPISRHVVCPTADLLPGTRKVVTMGGREIGVFNVDGRLHAFHNRCPHGGAAICSGVIVGLGQSSGPGDYRQATRRIPALSLVRLGIRHGDGPILARSRRHALAQCRSQARGRLRPRHGALCRRAISVEVADTYTVADI